MARMGVNFFKGASSVQGIGYATAAASSPRRAKITDFSFGCNASPADNTGSLVIQACTTAPTATALTPKALDAGDTLASTIVCNNLVTADGTLTANAFVYGITENTRATTRWVAVPGQEIFVPATASNGFMFGLSSASTTTYNVGMMFEEL